MRTHQIILLITARQIYFTGIISLFISDQWQIILLITNYRATNYFTNYRATDYFTGIISLFISDQ